MGYNLDVGQHGDAREADKYVPSVQKNSDFWPSGYYDQYLRYPEYISYFPQNTVNSGVNKIPYSDKYYPQNCQCNNELHVNKYKTAGFRRTNYDIKCADPSLPENEYIKDVFREFKEKPVYRNGNKILKGTVIKKYPVTVKMPRYVSKNASSTAISKRPSALCLPVITQPDPALVRKPSKPNHQIKKNLLQPEPLPSFTPEKKCTYSAHKMHSEGDVKNIFSQEGLEIVLDKYEHTMIANEIGDFCEAQSNQTGTANDKRLKEFAKSLKPRIPASIKIKQEKLARMRRSKTLQPKLKLSLDKLLNRLEKCEKNGNVETSSNSNEKSTDKTETFKRSVESFNYEELNRKLSHTVQREDQEKNPKLPINSLLQSAENRTVRISKPLDDHSALDLHKSKSYIVDLIDRALSKELGTVPRDQSVHHDLTPNKAVAAINRNKSAGYNELCYEVTAALTDSIISNATAPHRQASTQMVGCSSSDIEIKGKIYDENYIKQLKQLRWGHIRHIQQEARKLADLEKFLEKCGDVEH